ncbi:MAG TPA: PHB depolymerase family esterase [Herpetosiphonaceae bacterium]
MRRSIWGPLLALALVLVSISHPNTTRAGSWVTGSVSTSYGSRNYKLWVPAGYTGSSAVPLVMMLHGCTQSPDDFAAGTGMNTIAESANFLVVYPEQPSSADQNKCWKWFETAHQSRGSGEPAILAGIVNKIRSSYNVDGTRIYTAGLSAGGAMAVVMGATYPDLFSAIGVASGLEYKSATNMVDAWTAMRQGGPDPNQQGYAAYQAMGSAKRRVRAIVFHGTSDYTVYPVNGDQVAAQWAQTNDYIDDGSDNNSVDATADNVTRGTVSNGYTYTKSVYNDASGRPLLEKWIVDTMGHAWSGGSTAGSYTDPKGPRASQEIWRFFSAGPGDGNPPPPTDPGDTTPPILSITPAGGTFDAQVTVRMSLNETGSIYYTTDGSDPRTSPTRGSFTSNGTLTFANTTTLKAYGEDLARNASAVQSYTYTVNHPETTVTFISSGAEDGYAAANTATSTTGGYAVAANVYVGDNADAPFRGVLSFNTASIPDGATILGAELRLYYTQAAVGNPWIGMGYLVGDLRQGCLGTACSLAASDFEASVSVSQAVTFAAPSGTAGAGALVSGSLTSGTLPYINKTGPTQVKLRFQNNSNRNGYSDYLLLAGGEYFTSSYRPVLIVKYK